MVLAGYLYDVYIGTWSLFYMLIVAQGFFSSADLHRRRAVYGGDLAGPAARQRHGPQLWRRQFGGKVLGPLGLALIMGAGDIIKPAAPNLVMLGPALIYFASWYLLGVIGFWVFGPETKGRTFEEMDSALDAPGPRRQASRRRACRPDSAGPFRRGTNTIGRAAPGRSCSGKAGPEFAASAVAGDVEVGAVARRVVAVAERQPAVLQIGGAVAGEGQ